MTEISAFGELSNFKVNMSKSEILDVNLPPPDRRALATSFPFACTLIRPKSRGGLALPCPRTYYRACHLLRVVEWSQASRIKQWVDLEDALLGVPVSFLPWLSMCSARRLAAPHPFIRATLRAWHSLTGSAQLTTFPSPLTPLRDNPDFPPGVGVDLFPTVASGTDSRLRSFVTSAGLRPLEQLIAPASPTFLDRFRYAQLTNFYRSLVQRHNTFRALTAFETLCVSSSRLTHGVSHLYSLLLTALTPVPPVFMGRWEASLQVVLTEEQWEKVCILTHRCSLSNRDREMAYKLLAQCPGLMDYINLLVFLFAIETLNNDPNILPNITLGYHIYDSCLDEGKAVKSILQILSGPRMTVPNYSCANSNNVAGFIGDHHSTTTIPIAQLLGVYGYAQISYGATDYALSDRRVYPHFFRSVQNYLVYNKIILKILKHFGWTWVGILTVDDDTGETESQALRAYLTSYGICISFTVKIFLSKELSENMKMMSETVLMSSARIIILCGSFSIRIIDILTRCLKHKDITLILPPAWASNEHLTDYFVEPLNGSLAIELHALALPDTGSFFDNIHPSNRPADKLLEDIWILYYRCLSENSEKNRLYEEFYEISLYNCSGTPKLIAKTHLTAGVSPRVFISVSALAKALHDMHLFYNENAKENEIQNIYKHQLHRYIKRIIASQLGRTFYDEHGEFAYYYTITNWVFLSNKSAFRNIVGNFTEWAPDGQQLIIDSHLAIWRNKDNQIPRSQCSENCLPGYRKVLRPGTQICCYDCVRCSEGEISNRSDSENCIVCPSDKWSNEKRDRCIPKSVEFLSYLDAVAAVLSFVSILFCLVTVVILLIFIVFRDTPIVKANNKNLSFLLLVSIMLSFLCVFLFLGRPEDVTCMLRQTAFGVLFSLAVSCILSKTIMIYIVFKAAKPGSSWANWVNVKVSNSIVLLCSSIQVIINISWLAISPPFQELDMRSYQGKIIIQCNEGSVIAFYCVLGYMGLLAAVSFIIAFLARTLPDSFNEAKYITFSMLVFCSVWIAMIPAYLSTKGKNMVAVEIFAIVASSAGLVGCIFIPKCYVILFRQELNTKTYLLGSRIKGLTK
ncbi:vomeronasal type-2 receptor 26-like [Spea bombifrons]|uniref:vomeronasal type-2 receptor 26-like n=1 Tax=Spea bombifrons TaxID=233779 RepID=UPI00234A1B8B|nr:vomeronasal type-2 receptor 26-like [Spea bombifrons]